MLPQERILNAAEYAAAANEAVQMAGKSRCEAIANLKNGEITLQELFVRSETEQYLGAIRILRVLTSLPGIGRISANKGLELCGISSNCRLRALGDKQKADLCSWVGERIAS